MDDRALRNYVDGTWHRPEDGRVLDVENPATGQAIARVPLSSAEEVDRAVRAGAEAYEEWRRVPAPERVQPLFALKELLEEHLDELARLITDECGKTLGESRGELRRGIENVETACGIPSLMQGRASEDVSRGIDELMIRQPLGVVAAITPFNFPGMIPLWFLPYAIATGNCFVLKPSEKVPVVVQRIYALIDRIDLPDGVAQLVNGAEETATALIDHPEVRAISFVGSTPVARSVYERATARGKRAQCQGGAKNTVVVMPDADPDEAVRIVTDSAFGCAGQRCLANSLGVTVGEASDWFPERLRERAAAMEVGYGADEGVEMGPLISGASRDRVERMIEVGEREGARISLDGRDRPVPGRESGHFVRPTLLEGVPPDGEVAATEIFGPVFGLQHVETVEEAIERVNRGPYGNMACLLTESGRAARAFRSEVQAGNVGINVGVAAPMAFYPFSGWGESFFGDLHAQGEHAIEFYTQTKVVVERWG